jgi:energy-converting hydrogenase Eha subunit G
VTVEEVDLIKTEPISADLYGNSLRVRVSGRLKVDDFDALTQQVDSIISKFGTVRLLIDATGFQGWDSIAAFETHAGFIKAHQQKVERIAVIAGHEWQHWLVGAIRLFVHPEVRAYDIGNEEKALQWINR